MNETSFTVSSRTQVISVDPMRIVGFYENKILRILFNFQLAPDSLNKINWQLDALKANLSISGTNFILADCLELLSLPVTNQTNKQITLDFKLSDHMFLQMEKHRKGDLTLGVSLELFYCHFTRGLENNYVQGMSSRATAHIEFVIPQSEYVRNIYGPLSQNPILLLELPANLDSISKDFLPCVSELQQAVKYFKDHDFDKTVAHCRAAIEPIQQDFRRIERKYDSRSKSRWLKEVTEANFNWLEKMVGSTSSLSSKTHHLPSTGHFSRIEAQSIYLTTTSILLFLSELVESEVEEMA